MAGLNFTNYGPPAYITASVAPIFTNPGATKTYINAILLHNTDDAGAHAVTLYEVPNSAGSVGTFAASQRFFKRNLQAGETRIIEFKGSGLAQENLNDTIQAIADVTNVVTAKILQYNYA
jgi:hypothetical protein